MTGRRDPAGCLLRALTRSAATTGCDALFLHASETAWASATFVGAQHRVAVTGKDLAGWLAALPEADLPMPGCFVAGVEVAATREGAILTVLVLDE